MCVKCSEMMQKIKFCFSKSSLVFAFFAFSWYSVSVIILFMFILSTASLLWYELHHIFALARDAHYDGIDLSLTHGLYDTWDETYLREITAITNIPIVSITAPERRVTKELIKKIMKMTDSLGIKLVNFYPPHRLDPHKDWFWEYLAEVQSRYPDIQVSVINAPPKTFLFFIPEYGNARPEVTKKITGNSSMMIAHIDPNSGVDLMKTFALLGNTIRLIYLSDSIDDQHELFLWNGQMPLESLLIKLRDLSYTGIFALKVDPRELEVGTKEKVLERLIQAKQYFEKYFSGKKPRKLEE